MYRKIISGLAIGSGILALVLLILDDFNTLGPVLILFFLSLALAIRSFDSLKGFSFTILIFAAVTASKDLAIKEGPYSSFEGSPIAKGEFQYNLWNIKNIFF